MRYHITLSSTMETRLPCDHGEALRQVVYKILHAGDPSYVGFLENEGYVYDSSPYRMFGFSGLRAPANRRTISGSQLIIAPGTVEWYVGSPMKEFQIAFEDGLKQIGSIVIGGKPVQVHSYKRQPFHQEWGRVVPEYSRDAYLRHIQEYHCTCVSPITIRYHADESATSRQKLRRPSVYSASAEALYDDLAIKHKIAFGESPSASIFDLEWDRNFMDRAPRNGAKRVTIDPAKPFYVTGLLAPFRLITIPNLMRIAYACGLGDWNSYGLGMIAMATKPTMSAC